MELQFEKQRFQKRLFSMLQVDFQRMFTMPLVYIMAGISLALPILILVMTSMMNGADETVAEGFTNVWQSVGSLSGAGMAMDITGMCNINLLYFLVAVLVCIFVGEDFRSGYAKNLFVVRPKKSDYVFSKTLVLFVGAALMFVMYFAGTFIGGAIAGLSFSTEGFGAGGAIACSLSKICMAAVFVAVSLLLSTAAKHRLWISIPGSMAAGMLLFTSIPTVAPLDAGVLNVLICFAGGVLSAVGFGAISARILNKTNLV